MNQNMETNVRRSALDIIRGYDGPPVRIMEVCGTHTHAIFEQGIRGILPENIHLISGPGCPVCVTETGFIDEAVCLALEKNAVIATFGDLVRVPGTEMNLAGVRARGGDVKIVYSPLDAVELAKENPKLPHLNLDGIAVQPQFPPVVDLMEHSVEAAAYRVTDKHPTLEGPLLIFDYLPLKDAKAQKPYFKTIALHRRKSPTEWNQKIEN